MPVCKVGEILTQAALMIGDDDASFPASNEHDHFSRLPSRLPGAVQLHTSRSIVAGIRPNG